MALVVHRFWLSTVLVVQFCSCTVLLMHETFLLPFVLANEASVPLAGGAAGSDQLGSMTSDGQAAYLSAGHHSKQFACLLFLQVLSWLYEGVCPCCILAKCPLAGRICSPRWINEAPCFWLERAPALQCGCGPAVLPLNIFRLCFMWSFFFFFFSLSYLS